MSEYKKSPAENDENNRDPQAMELEIEKLSFGGDGIARKDNLVYFVPFTAPGDKILAKVIEKRKNFARAEITKILSPSVDRVTPPCPHYGKCGGCNWQHLSYAGQVSQKDLILKEQLKKLNLNSELFLPVIKSPQTWNYRNRIQMRIANGKFGFYGRKTHDLIEVKDCLIAEPALNYEIPRLKDRAELKEGVEKIEIYLNQENHVSIRNTAESTDDLGFSQVNTQQNSFLINSVVDWASGLDFSEILDLYGGSGNFSFPLLTSLSGARTKPQVICVELSSAAIKFGRALAQKKGIPNKVITFLLADVESYLKRIGIRDQSLVILDPPRAGCSSAVMNILKTSLARRILYISCNPSSLARDLEILLSDKRFSVKKIQPFDMFPQTDHIETLVQIDRIL